MQNNTTIFHLQQHIVQNSAGRRLPCPFQISIVLSGSISLKSLRFTPVLASAFFIRSFLLSLANFTCFLCCQYGCSSIFSKCRHCLFRQALPRICLTVSPHWCSLHTAQQFSDSQWNNVVMLLLLSCRFVLPWVFCVPLRIQQIFCRNTT